MEVRTRILKPFVTIDGKCPYNEWFLDLKDMKTQALVDARLTRLRQGNPGKFRSVGRGVKELKIDYGPGYRIYFAEENETIVILLCAGDKKTQTKDIQKAQKLWAEYLR